MSQFLRFSNCVERDPAIAIWLNDHPGELGAVAWHWFQIMRNRGADVREVFHDGCPVACVGDAPFGYVNAFKAHVNVGFFRGAELPDPSGLLVGTGRFMRHVKLRSAGDIDAAALTTLIEAAYVDMKRRLTRRGGS